MSEKITITMDGGADEEITVNITDSGETNTITFTETHEEITVSINEAARGATGEDGQDGATTFAALTDKATVDLPAINTPLSGALALKSDKSNVIERDNTGAFTPTADYHPATKKYVDDNAGGGAGDMLAATYDPTSVSGDAFDMENMAEGATKKILTAAERAILGNTSGTNTGDETAIGIRTKLSTVDGTGSGLDADLLDGIEASAFQTKSQLVSDGYGTPNTGLKTDASGNLIVNRITGNTLALHDLSTGYTAYIDGENNLNANRYYTPPDASGTLALTSDIPSLSGYQLKPSEGAFANGDKTKLDGIEAGADVTDATNVTAAGALMDSEVTNLAQVKAFDSTDYATAAQGALADSATQPGDLGTAAALNVGTSANNVIQLDGTAKLPAVDGSQLTNLPGGGDLSAADIDTLAELNAIITDATLIDTGDSRLSDARTPTAHTHTASEVTDFDTEVANNSAVAANTAKVSNANHTGDVSGSTALTLATVNANVGTWGSATQVPSFTVNGKGLVTAAATFAVAPPLGSITGLGTGVDAALAIALNSTGGFATINGTATLTNKTMSGASNTFTNIPISTAISGLGTGVATALAVALNSTGGFATINGTATLTNKTLSAPTVTDYTESVVAIGNTGTSKTISLASGTVQTATLTGNCTFTMPTATAGKSFILYLKTGAGSYTGTFTGVKWAGGTAPTITTTASKMDILSFVADGTNWYGSVIQNFTP